MGLAIKTLAVFSLVLPVVTRCRVAETDAPGERADALFSDLVSASEPGAAVLVLKDGRAVFEGGWGVTDLRTKGPIGAHTNFRLASVTKQFTATAIMLLVRDGKLRYDDRLTDIFPDFPDYGRSMTVRHLLNHTSGLPDYEDLMPPADASLPVVEVQIKDAGVLGLLRTQKAGRFVPGARWAYSNSGYVVLGLIVEKISGRPFADFLNERIFVPLGMSGSVAYVRGRNEVPDRAYGHALKDGRWIENDQSPTSATLGDGGVYSSLADLAAWDEALSRNTLLSEADMRPALSPVRVAEAGPVGPDGTAAEYGFGWFLDPWKGRTRMWHYGETAGFRTAIQRFTGDGLTVIVLSNRDDLDARGLALRTAEFFLEGSRSAGGPDGVR